MLAFRCVFVLSVYVLCELCQTCHALKFMLAEIGVTAENVCALIGAEYALA